MGWYPLAQDYFDGLNGEEKNCLHCHEPLEVGKSVYFIDFAKNKVIHFHCVDDYDKVNA